MKAFSVVVLLAAGTSVSGTSSTSRFWIGPSASGSLEVVEDLSVADKGCSDS